METLGQCVEGDVIQDRLYCSHKMPVVAIVAIVVPKYTSIIRADRRIDVGQNVFHDLAVVRLPYFCFEGSARPRSFQFDRQITIFVMVSFLATKSTMTQVGCNKPHLKSYSCAELLQSGPSSALI
jgi:hypothetical protein